MSRENAKNTKNIGLQKPTLKKIKTTGDITEYLVTSNNMRVLFCERKDTGIVTSNIVYNVGARDEGRGETGLAHMLEHMLFKPTTHDIERKTDSAAMLFERETGCTLNANTWKDRTTYFFSYPVEHFNRALGIEAERMHDVILTNTEFLPERTNVLSEFDMHAGDEQFLLGVQMAGVALQSHPYGHETIGYREDIEDYTTEKLQNFYKKFYAPNNATLIIVGDIQEDKMRENVLRHFGSLSTSKTLTPRTQVREPKQEGQRTVIVKKPSTTNMFAYGVLHEGFPTKEWFETLVIFDMLAGGKDSILQRELIDKGLATAIHTSLEPTYDRNLGLIFITLNRKANHERIHKEFDRIIMSLSQKEVASYLKKTIAKTISSEYMNRENSLGYVAELVEYVSAGVWESFFDSEKLLQSITPADIYNRLQGLFSTDQTTIGHYIGTKTL